jgi:hypothetical protein
VSGEPAAAGDTGGSVLAPRERTPRPDAVEAGDARGGAHARMARAAARVLAAGHVVSSEDPAHISELTRLCDLAGVAGVEVPAPPGPAALGVSTRQECAGI